MKPHRRFSAASEFALRRTFGAAKVALATGSQPQHPVPSSSLSSSASWPAFAAPPGRPAHVLTFPVDGRLSGLRPIDPPPPALAHAPWIAGDGTAADAAVMSSLACFGRDHSTAIGVATKQVTATTRHVAAHITRARRAADAAAGEASMAGGGGGGGSTLTAGGGGGGAPQVEREARVIAEARRRRRAAAAARRDAEAEFATAQQRRLRERQLAVQARILRRHDGGPGSW